MHPHRRLRMRLVRLLPALLGAVLLGACSLGISAEAPADRARVSVLIIDGVSNHNWRLNTALLRGILEPTGLFEVEVSPSAPPGDALGWECWRPNFAAYDVVIQTYNDIHGGPPWPAQVQEDF